MYRYFCFSRLLVAPPPSRASRLSPVRLPSIKDIRTPTPQEDPAIARNKIMVDFLHRVAHGMAISMYTYHMKLLSHKYANLLVVKICKSSKTKVYPLMQCFFSKIWLNIHLYFGHLDIFQPLGFTNCIPEQLSSAVKLTKIS